jgi:hypothetical protein
MFQLLNPIWLFGMGGIIIPILIHLWNVKKGKTLKIGSVNLLGESSRQNARSMRLLDLILLLLRCLLIIIISILLAEPVWISIKSPGQQGGWILIEKDNFKETYSNYRKEIDSLDQAGYDLRLFEPGFKSADLNQLKNSESIVDRMDTRLSYWSLIKLLDQEIPDGKEAYVFTPNRLNRFQAERPEIVTKIKWNTYTPKDSTASWIESAWFTGDSIRAIITQTEPKGSRKIAVNIDPNNKNSVFSIAIQKGNSNLSFKNTDSTAQIPVLIDTSTIRIAVYTDKFKKDAEYLIAAILAIKKYTGRKIELRTINSGLINGSENILFWLSEKMPSEIQIKKLRAGSSLFMYKNGKTEEVNSTIVLPEYSLQKEAIPLRKRISLAESSKNNYAVWEDGFGKPLLELEITDKLRLYHFYSHFNQEWNGMVWNDDFAKILIPFLIPTIENPGSHLDDRRSVASSWIIPAKRAPKSRIIMKNTETNLKNIFWVSLMLLFLAERWLSYKKQLD